MTHHKNCVVIGISSLSEPGEGANVVVAGLSVGEGSARKLILTVCIGTSSDVDIKICGPACQGLEILFINLIMNPLTAIDKFSQMVRKMIQ